MRLEKYLTLDNFFLSLLGFSEFEELRAKLKDQKEGFEGGRTFFVDTIIGFSNLKISDGDLLRYDAAIRQYVEALRRNRKQPSFNLKYFQYLSVLFAEIFLDRFHNHRDAFINELNAFAEEFNSENGYDIKPYTEGDLKKIAFWIATGGGKTLIMHINYWQFFKYSCNKYDNIILITPNEGLSSQHYTEMRRSGIPCKLYDGNPDNLKTSEGEVLILDIYKLTQEKTGEGVTIDVSYFDGKNLVFIDEGHKGQKSEEQTWKKLREQIGKEGFIFEYSATFGQVIGKDKELLEEYSKSIIFDYSYKYFYTDGYGKDFYVYNLREDRYTERYTDLILTANLLSYYEQLLLYEENKEKVSEIGSGKPLWVFIGSKVSGRGLESDVIRVILFLKKVLSDKGFLEANAEKILKGKSGLVDDADQDIFRDKLQEIKKKGLHARALYDKVFNGSGTLELFEIKNADGEIGLRVSEKYFGVVNIGDVDSVKKLLREVEIEVKDDNLSLSLFSTINEESSAINILIGSKKFIEGWDSWRVSSMGLINMGKGEGPQIIQIFGRGVRLKGKDFSLKRSENTDYVTRAMQTLLIFGFNADYINAFLESIKTEEVEFEEVSIPIQFNRLNRWLNKIYTIRTQVDFDFINHLVDLEVDEKILSDVQIDLAPKIALTHGLEIGAVQTISIEPMILDEAHMNMIDMDIVYLQIMDYKVAKGYYNLLIQKDILTKILKTGKYRILTTAEQRNINSFSEVFKIQDMILTYLKAYVDKFYRRAEKREAMKNLRVAMLGKDDENLNFGEIILSFPKDEDVAEEIKKFVKQLNKIHQQDSELIPTVHFDSHLYTPLVVYSKGRENIKSTPVKLNKGETKFVRELRQYLLRHRQKIEGEIFLLRNQSRRGIGFFQSSGFYPDFIMWIKNDGNQKIIFLDPKGLMNLGNFKDEKIQFCTTTIKEIEESVKNKVRTHIELESYILSVTPYETIKAKFDTGNHSKEEFEQHNVVFLEEGWAEKIMLRLACAGGKSLGA